MIFNAKYVNLELIQTEKTLTSGKLKITLRRNSEYYFNREGIIIRLTNLTNGASEIIGVWYSDYRKDDIDQYPLKGAGFGYTGTITEDSFFQYIHDQAIPRITEDSTSRIGTMKIRVELIENGSAQTVIVSGDIVIQTLEIAKPVFHALTVRSEVINGTDTLVATVEGVNPNDIYELILKNDFEGQVASVNADGVEYSRTIPDIWRKEVITFTAEYMLGETTMETITTSYKIPTTDLGLSVRIADLDWRKVKKMYIKLGSTRDEDDELVRYDGKNDGTWKEVSNIYRKNRVEIDGQIVVNEFETYN